MDNNGIEFIHSHFAQQNLQRIESNIKAKICNFVHCTFNIEFLNKFSCGFNKRQSV